MSQAQTREQQQIQTYQALTSRREAAREEFGMRKAELKVAEEDYAEKSKRTQQLLGTSDTHELKKQYDDKIQQNDQTNVALNQNVTDIENILAEIATQMSKLQ